MKNYSKVILALVGGGLLVLSFAPFAFRFIAFLSPALLLWCLLDASRQEAAIYSFLFGLSFFGFGASWIYISIHTFGEAPLLIALLITLLFTIALALFTAFLGYSFSLYKNSLGISCLAIFPSLWTCSEWLRSWVLTGFPWLFLGYSQVNTSLKYFAPFVGVYGLSFLVCLISGALILLLKGNFKQKIMALAVILLCWSGTSILSHYHLASTTSIKLSVSLIQGNIPQSLKWDAEQASKTLSLYKNLSLTQPGNNLIVWPEAAIPIVKSQAKVFLDYMNNKLKRSNQILITGIPIDAWPNFYNGILMLGKAKGEYRKIHLVPFGEYYPLKWLLNPVFDYLKIPMSDLSPGPSSQALFNVHNVLVAPFVCYEIAYPQQVLRQSLKAEALITLSDDSWFGESIAAAQHLEIARLRALETQRYLIFSTNSGISAVVNPQGELIAQLGMNKQGVIHTQIQSVNGSTPLMKWGYSPLALLITLLLAIGFKIRIRGL